MEIKDRLRTYEPIFKEYTVVKPIGKGAFSIVFEVQKAAYPNQKAALKFIPLNMDDVREIDRYKQEIEILKSLPKNDNIASGKNFGLQKHPDKKGVDLLILMELFDSNIEKLIKDKNYIFTEDEIINIGISMCGALEAIHEAGIIHRDIKPENILISSAGDYKLADFGIAKKSFSAITSSSRGTPIYAAPEVIRMERIDHKCDIYSLGLMMYVLLNQKRFPFEPENATISQLEDALGKRVRGEEFPMPATIPKKYPKLVDAIIKAIQYDSSHRHENATQMKATLEELLKTANRSDIIESNKNDNFVRAKESSWDDLSTENIWDVDLMEDESFDDSKKKYSTLRETERIKNEAPESHSAPVFIPSEERKISSLTKLVAVMGIMFLLAFVVGAFVLVRAVREDETPVSQQSEPITEIDIENIEAQVQAALDHGAAQSEEITSLPFTTEMIVVSDADNEIVNIRSGVGMNYDALRVLPNRSSVMSNGVIRADNEGIDWEYVRFDGTEGWVAKSFLRRPGDVPPLPSLDSPDAPALRVEQPPPVADQQPPAVNQPPPVINQQPPVVNQPPPLAANQQPPAASTLSIEAKLAHIRNVWDDARRGQQNGTYHRSVIANGITRYSSGANCIVEVVNGTDNVRYSRTYLFQHGQLLFAFWEGNDAQRFYFNNNRMFRWIDTPPNGQRVIYDNRHDLHAYNRWENTVFNDINRLGLSSPPAANQPPASNQLPPPTSAANIEANLAHIRNVWDNARSGQQNGTFHRSVVANGITRYSSGANSIVEVVNGTGNIRYSRTYLFQNGQLLFAFWEGNDAQRFYFNSQRMFRWIDTPPSGQRVIYDNRQDLAAYNNWERSVFEDIRLLGL